jgi:hypothetical protein
MTVEIDAVELPQHLRDLLPTAPTVMDRKRGAQFVSDHVFPVSPQTLKQWQIGWEMPNGRAIATTERFLKYAWNKAQSRPNTTRWGRSAT